MPFLSLFKRKEHDSRPVASANSFTASPRSSPSSSTRAHYENGSTKAWRRREVESAGVVADLRHRVELLDMREQLLQNKIEAERQRAVSALQRQNKQEALACLRRKSLYTSHMTANAAARERLEQQMIAIETARTNQDIHQAIVLGNRELRRLQKEVTIDQVDDAMSDLQEMLEYQDTVTMALSQPVRPEAWDEEQLEDELAELEGDEMEASLLKTDGAVEAAGVSTRAEAEWFSAQLDKEAADENRAAVPAQVPHCAADTATTTATHPAQTNGRRAVAVKEAAPASGTAAAQRLPEPPRTGTVSSSGRRKTRDGISEEERRELGELAASMAIQL